MNHDKLHELTDLQRLQRDVAILKRHQMWRRGEMPLTPRELGIAIDTAIECMEKLIVVRKT